MIDWKNVARRHIQNPKQLELFEKEPSYKIWLSEVNHERRMFSEVNMLDDSKARRQYNRLVAQGFWN